MEPKELTYHQRHYLKHRDRIRLRQAQANFILRLEVMSHYGLACACCGETEYKFLGLDHIAGGGHKHRTALRKRGTAFYRWIKAQGLPDGYQVLCHNCNLAKGFYGECPHKTPMAKEA